jgi:hypothetical protein
MNKFAIALLATTMLATPAAFAASNDQQPQQQPQAQQQMQQKPQSQQSMQQKPSQQAQENSNQQQAQENQKQNEQNAQNQNRPQGQQQQTAENNQPISPQDLSRDQVRKIQQALDKEGFKSGHVDGIWGHETQNAVKQFQQSKQLPATGQLDEQTVADLGLNTSQFMSSQNQNSMTVGQGQGQDQNSQSKGQNSMSQDQNK